MNQDFSDRWPDTELSWWRRLIKDRPILVLCLCIVYIISPIDLLPEAFLGPFGLIDDLGALFVAIAAFKRAFCDRADRSE